MLFQDVYREHFATIWRAVQRFGVPQRDALDAAQEVFVIAYRRFGEFEGRSAMRTWLFGIAFRVSAARRRRAENRREVLQPHTRSEPEASGEDPERALQRHELLRLLDVGLAKLPLEQRVVFTLFELEGLSGEEIAAALEVPVGTVRSRLRLARVAFSRTVRALSGHATGADVCEEVVNE